MLDWRGCLGFVCFFVVVVSIKMPYNVWGGGGFYFTGNLLLRKLKRSSSLQKHNAQLYLELLVSVQQSGKLKGASF